MSKVSLNAGICPMIYDIYLLFQTLAVRLHIRYSIKCITYLQLLFQVITTVELLIAVTSAQRPLPDLRPVEKAHAEKNHVWGFIISYFCQIVTAAPTIMPIFTRNTPLSYIVEEYSRVQVLIKNFPSAVMSNQRPNGSLVFSRCLIYIH